MGETLIGCLWRIKYPCDVLGGVNEWRKPLFNAKEGDVCLVIGLCEEWSEVWVRCLFADGGSVGWIKSGWIERV